jgi:hypothetical protein
MTAMLYRKRRHQMPRPRCSECRRRKHITDMICEDCADDRVAEAQPDADDTESVIREQYARTLAGIYRDIQRGRITEALERLDRGVLVELDSAWRTLV